jgi:hypothetical protein
VILLRIFNCEVVVLEYFIFSSPIFIVSLNFLFNTLLYMLLRTSRASPEVQTRNGSASAPPTEQFICVSTGGALVSCGVSPAPTPGRSPLLTGTAAVPHLTEATLNCASAQKVSLHEISMSARDIIENFQL